MQTYSTPYPYYQRKPNNHFSYKHSTSSQSFTESPLNQPFNQISQKKPSSFYPKENPFRNFRSSEHHDEHIKNLHLQKGLVGTFHKEGDLDFDLATDPKTPKRKKKLRGSRPTRNKNKTPNIFETYFNVLRDGFNLPALPPIGGGKKDKTRQPGSGMKKRRKRKKWNEAESFMGDFMGTTDDIFRLL